MEEYIIYKNLGDELIVSNVNQAYLCYENAVYLCDDSDIRAELVKKMEMAAKSGIFCVRKTSIVIVSYNSMYLMQKCVESIRSSCPEGSYEIVVVDNASVDGVREWLCSQEDIKVILVDENVGFPRGCNIAAYYAEPHNDIFLLNNDTRLAHNSLFWLRMGLYSDKRNGAAGSCSNYAGNDQWIKLDFELPSQYLDFGKDINVPMYNPYEERVRLSGFAVLIKREVWDVCGGMDESFSPGYFEDDDLSMRILINGYRLVLCLNSFIYHAGSQSFAQVDGINELLENNRKLFKSKYGFDIIDYASIDKSLVEQIPFSPDAEINILQIGSGLGADIKYIRSRFPKAHIVGIEKNSALRSISEHTDLVADSLESLKKILKPNTFHVAIIAKSMYATLKKEDLSILQNMCRKDCVIVPDPLPKYSKFPFSKLKMVIWDLDDTFWKGTLSEGNIHIIPENIELIKKMADCGIISSISSKNDIQEVFGVLELYNIREYFVFMDVNWDNKGGQIHRKLKNMGLRAENTLFIDDNIHNLEEAVFFNEGLLTAKPDIIDMLAGYVDRLPVNDIEHKRLQQYHVLEKKCDARETFSSDEEFLYSSDIHIVIRDDCENVIDRISELVLRTNQLNYTKNRSTKDELLEQIACKDNLCGYVTAYDKFGDYGIIGFYCYSQTDKKVIHLLFSCRVLGMGIEKMVYVLLGTPDFVIAQPVATRLDKNADAPWVHVDIETYPSQQKENTKGKTGKAARILLKGPCDLSAIEGYLLGADVVKEFNYVNDEGFITTGQNHSMNIWESANFSEEQLSQIFDEVPFITKGDFTTSIFDADYNIVCYSLLPDCHAGLYMNRNTGAYISFGSRNFDLTDIDNMQGYIDGTIVNHRFPFTEDIIKKFAQEWEFVGATPEDMLIRNLDYMVTNAKGNPDFIFLLGSEIEYEGVNEEFAGHAAYHREINEAVRQYAKDNKRIRLIEITNFIHSQADYLDCINHFTRNVYYDIATELCSCINKFISEKKVKKNR